MKYIILLFLQFFILQMSYASVSMAGTRVIFPAEQSDKTLQFSNDGSQPFLVQIWIDNPEDSYYKEKTLFVASPQVFQMAPKTGQTVRLIFTGNQQLPKDRESIFYLNFKQLPAIKKESIEKNKIVNIVNSKLKLLYRPKNIKTKIENLPGSIKYSIEKHDNKEYIVLHNPTGYYANITQLFLKKSEKIIEVNNVDMIAPFESRKFITEELNENDIKSVSMTIVSDYGAYNKYSIERK